MDDTGIDQKQAFIPPSNSSSTIAVVAPADLNEGFTFQAEHDGKTFTVTVPSGGVKQGQTITVPFTQVVYGELVEPAFNVPTGYWRDDLCSCFKHGLCEPTCCLALWFTNVVLAQVMRRMKMTWYGGRSTDSSGYKNTCQIVTAILFIWSVLGVVETMTAKFEKVCDGDNNCRSVQKPTTVNTIFGIIVMFFGFFFLTIGTVTRMRMRDAFDIPGSCCGDCCTVLCCGCCALIQEARHTHEYKEGETKCCTTTGLKPNAPEITLDV